MRLVVSRNTVLTLQPLDVLFKHTVHALDKGPCCAPQLTFRSTIIFSKHFRLFFNYFFSRSCGRITNEQLYSHFLLHLFLFFSTSLTVSCAIDILLKKSLVTVFCFYLVLYPGFSSIFVAKIMEWSYTGLNGPDNWAKLYSAACGSRQSPIDIETGCLTPHCAHAGQKLKWRYSPNELITVKNTGHAWQINADDSMSEVSGGPLNCDYELSQVHCHWGEEDAEGSEHTVNGKHYPGELHLVHWNKTNYCSVEEAIKHPDGLCVFAVFLKVGNTHNELQKLVEKIPEIIHKGESATLSAPLNIKNILPKKHAYWSYMGSLTTPPCLECVIWIIFSEAIEVSHEQLEAFRTLRSHPKEMCKDMNCCDGQLKHNYRPTAPLGERVIVASDS